MRTLSYQGITWHDDPSPTEAELRRLQQQYGFHELDIEDCLSEHERPKIEEYDEYLFLVFHIPYLSTRTGRVLKEEINIFLGQEYIVTIHEGKIPILDQLWRELQESHAKRQEYLEKGTSYFLYELMHHFFDGVFPLVDMTVRNIRQIEHQLFESSEELSLLKDIMNLKRNIISMRSILLPQRTLIATLEHKNKRFIPEELTIYFDDILDAIERQWSLLDTAKEMIDAIQDTHETWLGHRTNAIVRVLTIFSVTMLPLTLLTGFYGMNVRLPFGDHPYASFGITGVMLGVLATMLVYFWRKRWL